VIETLNFNVKEAMSSGVFVCGCRQVSGKTNLAKNLVQALIDSSVLVYILDPSRAWSTNSPIMRTAKFTGNESVSVDLSRSVVLDLAELGYNARADITNQVCKALLDLHLKSGFTQPTVLVFEECQATLYNGALRSPAKNGSVADYILIGGNFGCSFVAVTQFSSQVDKQLVKAAGQRFFGRTDEANDLKYLRNFFENDKRKELEQQLRTLNLGEFLYQHRGSTQKFKVERYQKPESSNQKPYLTVTYNYANSGVV
jgi:hypothetical protein